jgi:hypothetical protein
MQATAPALPLAERIHTVRGHKVMLDADLADLYAVPTKALVQSVKRNRERFPRDFVFQLTYHEVARLRSQIVTSNGRGDRRRRHHEPRRPDCWPAELVARNMYSRLHVQSLHPIKRS